MDSNNNLQNRELVQLNNLIRNKMKKFLLLTAVLIVTATTQVQAQLNYFLPDSNAYISITDSRYIFNGDTIIDNKRYTKVDVQYCHSETDCPESYRHYYAALREDTLAGRIYCLRSGDGIERLLADFNVQPGDQIDAYSYWFYSQDPAVVKAVDSILINNQYRKRIIIQEYENYSYPADSWVEGLGSVVYGLFFPHPSSVVDVGDPPHFLCFYNSNGDLVYQNPKYDTCYMEFQGIAIASYGSNQDLLTLYPTLTHDKLNVELKESLALPYQYDILNTIGKQVGGGTLTTDYIDVSYLAEGFYFIHFYNKKNTHVYSKKFIKL
jgi:hypothetical protein